MFNIIKECVNYYKNESVEGQTQRLCPCRILSKFNNSKDEYEN